jgi:putative restriction endonuclease
VPRFFGTPEGVFVGQIFESRLALHKALVHRPPQGGISGEPKGGADSIVISGGYIDDEDHGDYLIYTGHGGQDPSSKRQIADQSISAQGNAGLLTSMIEGLPVRVTRGPRVTQYAPPAGFQYAGLFSVTSYLTKPGRDGFLVIQFRLDRLTDQAALLTAQPVELDPAYVTTNMTRRVRDSALSREIKRTYANRCQVCGIAIPAVGDRLYSEGAHIRPLGRPHMGRRFEAEPSVFVPQPPHAAGRRWNGHSGRSVCSSDKRSEAIRDVGVCTRAQYRCL